MARNSHRHSQTVHVFLSPLTHGRLRVENYKCHHRVSVDRPLQFSNSEGEERGLSLILSCEAVPAIALMASANGQSMLAMYL